jgi:hypothetical protein
METFAPPHPTTNLSPNVYFQIVHTLTTLLPPPLDDSPGALHARNHTAIAKVASMFPVNANEADIAARSVVAGAQADDVMRLIRENAHDFALTMRLSAQYASMARTSAAAQASLLRVQAVRRKREAIKGAADQDAWTRHVVEQSMLRVADPSNERVMAASGEATGEPRKAAPDAPPATQGDRRIAENVSQYNTKSHDAAFETQMSEVLGDHPDETGLRKHVREATADARVAGQDASADGRAGPGGTGLDHAAEPNHAAPEKSRASRAATQDEAELADILRETKDMIAETHAQIAATTAATLPDPSAPPGQAAPARSAAPSAAPTFVAPAPAQNLQPPRMANLRDKLLWADAMTTVAKEMDAGLSAIPPAYRKQQSMRARLLSSVARDVALLATGAAADKHAERARAFAGENGAKVKTPVIHTAQPGITPVASPLNPPPQPTPGHPHARSAPTPPPG